MGFAIMTDYVIVEEISYCHCKKPLEGTVYLIVDWYKRCRLCNKPLYPLQKIKELNSANECNI